MKSLNQYTKYPKRILQNIHCISNDYSLTFSWSKYTVADNKNNNQPSNILHHHVYPFCGNPNIKTTQTISINKTNHFSGVMITPSEIYYIMSGDMCLLDHKQIESRRRTR
jgi:hypothetical protein